MHGSAIDRAEAGAGADGTAAAGFTVIARMKIERANYQSGRIPSTLNGRAVPCAPAESNGGQRCAALQERLAQV